MGCGMSLVCKSCYRELLEEEMPDNPREKLSCPQCQSGEFLAKPDPPAEPKKKWKLSHNDRRFLKGLRIKPEDTDGSRSKT